MYIMLSLQKMHEETNRMLAKKLRGEGRPYHEIAAISCLSVFSVRSLCVYNKNILKNVDQNLKLTTEQDWQLKGKLDISSIVVRKFGAQEWLKI